MKGLKGNRRKKPHGLHYGQHGIRHTATFCWTSGPVRWKGKTESGSRRVELASVGWWTGGRRGRVGSGDAGCGGRGGDRRCGGDGEGGDRGDGGGAHNWIEGGMGVGLE